MPLYEVELKRESYLVTIVEANSEEEAEELAFDEIDGTREFHTVNYIEKINESNNHLVGKILQY